jgi:hypothetical protein
MSPKSAANVMKVVSMIGMMSAFPETNTMTTNPFEDLADSASRPTRKKMQREAVKTARQPMVPTAMEKKQRDKGIQMRLFLKWKREIRQGMIDGDYGPDIVQLLRLLRTIPDSDVLVNFVKNSKWLLQSDQRIKDNVLGYIMSCMARWNVRHGLAPLNDSLPHEPDSPSVIVLKLLRGKI